MENISKQNRYFSLLVFSCLALIFIIIGLIFIYSSSSVYALEKFGSAHYFVKKQLIGLMLGIFALIFCQFFSLQTIKKFTPLFFLFALLFSILPLVSKFGQSLNGSSRWINIAGIGFQPSELLKLAFILYIAYLLTKKQNRLRSLISGYFPLLIVVGITAATLLKQPDFGQTVTLSTTAFILFFLADCQLKHILSTAAAFIPAGIALIYMKPYRLKRIMTFLNPWDDPQGAGFQIIQSLIAIGSGNISGVGIAQSKQKFFYLPMQHTDFIFSIIAEETGFIGSTILISLYALFLYTGLKISTKLKDPFSFYCCVGFTILTALQVAINLFVATGLLPTKGLGLPFISYGNSALICNLLMVGLIINFVRNNNRLQNQTEFS